MAGKRQRANGSWEYVFKRAGVLDKPVYMSFPSEAEGDAYAARVEALLAKGIVPAEVQPSDRRILLIDDLVRVYLRDAHPSQKDQGQLATIAKARGHEPLQLINAAWVDAWITELKRVERLKPGTITAKVGALARCTDWGMRKGHVVMPDHPFRSLPNGYAQYTEADAAFAGGPVEDNERDRRLEEGEWERILAVIAGGVLPRKQRPRPLPDPAALRCLVVLAVESAMRLREMYTLMGVQVDLKRKTVFLDKTKNGSKRQVPLSSVALAELRTYLVGHQGERLFPWWDGDTSPRALRAMTDYLSSLLADVFKQAGCPGLLFHDLRHEAVSRLFERTTLSEAEIMKVTGHKSLRMLLRYANLRGSNLADALW